MSFSINPFEFLKIMSERRKMSREQVIEWLEAVRTDGRLLSEAWTDIAEIFGEEKLLSANEIVGQRKTAHQGVIARRLWKFHSQATSAIAGRIEPAFWNEFLDRLGGVIVARAETRAELEKIAGEQKTAELTLAYGLPEVQRISNIKGVIKQLQEQLAALDVFIQTIKCAPKAIR
jgi:hypothetical protein